MSFARAGVSFLEAIAWIPVGIAFTQNVFSVVTIKGNSMQPTFNPDSSWQKDLVLLNRFRIAERSFKRGDIVTLWDPRQPQLLITKRIIALDGDLVRTLPPCPDSYVRIPQGHAWVEGDENFHSGDSNHFGPVSLSLIDATVEAIIWPFSRAGFLKPPSPHLAALSALPQNRRSNVWRHFRTEAERVRLRMARVFVARDTGIDKTFLEEEWKRRNR